MGKDLNAALRRLSEQPLHPRLADLESEMLKLIAAERRGGSITMSSAIAAAVGAVTLVFALRQILRRPNRAKKLDVRW